MCQLLVIYGEVHYNKRKNFKHFSKMGKENREAEYGT